MRAIARITLTAMVLLLSGSLLVCCGGPQRSPEGVARAFLEARAAGDEAQWVSYVSPSTDRFAFQFCNEGPSIRIDQVLTEKGTWWSEQAVTLYFQGEFHRVHWTLNTCEVVTEKLSGKWYVQNCNCSSR